MDGKWRTMSLRQAGVSLIDCDHRTPPAADSGYPYVAIPQLKEGRLDLSTVRRISPEHFVEWTRKAKPRHHDVILSRRCNPGETAHVPAGLECALGQNLVLLRSDGTKVFPPFLRWLLHGPDWWEQIGTFINVGAIFNSLKCVDIPNFKLPLPPLAEQKAIAAVLGALDDKIELNRRMNATLEAMARALFQSWFVDFDPVRAKLDGRVPSGLDKGTINLFPTHFQETPSGPIPQGWIETDLGQEVDFLTGFAFKSEMFLSCQPGVRLARGDNVKEGAFHWDSKTRYWPEAALELERYRLNIGDVLIGMDGSKVGKNWVRVRGCDLPCLLVQRVARLRASSSVGQHFIWLLISDPRFRFHVEAVKTGTSIPHISGGQIKAYDFIRPPKGDNRLFHRFEELVSPIGQQMDTNIEQTLTLAALRDALLPKLLSGELRLQEAERIVDRTSSAEFHSHKLSHC